jgi:hypothetical protein
VVLFNQIRGGDSDIQWTRYGRPVRFVNGINSIAPDDDLIDFWHKAKNQKENMASGGKKNRGGRRLLLDFFGDN